MKTLIKKLLREELIKESTVDFSDKISSLVNDELGYDKLAKLLRKTPNKDKLEMVNQIWLFIKDNLNLNELDPRIGLVLLHFTPEKNRLEMVNKMLPLFKENLTGSYDEDGGYHFIRTGLLERLIKYTPKEQWFDLFKQIAQSIKDKLNGGMVQDLLNNVPNEIKFNDEKFMFDLINVIFPLVKDKLDAEMVKALRWRVPREHGLEMFKRILSLVKDRLDDDMVKALLFGADEEHKEHMQGLINKAKGLNNSGWGFEVYESKIY